MRILFSPPSFDSLNQHRDLFVCRRLHAHRAHLTQQQLQPRILDMARDEGVEMRSEIVISLV
jgi:hypothetical protein